MEKEQMNIVIVGHVDHGKSTVIGRLLADTDSLPEGKLEQVKAYCANNSKPFEYAFLLDALKDEQAQGITIDSARCFFKSKKRDYIIIDAPGHIEFLKNMVSGAARAEAAILVIDAKEGVKENSKRHGYVLSMLGIKQVIVVVNKMDLVDYSKEVFDKIVKEYSDFLKEINISAKEFIPVSAFNGDNIAKNTQNLSWFKGNNILSALDSFEKEPALEDKAFRMPVQDIYKFTKEGDDRRLVVGRIESGSVNVEDEVIFLPSNKKSKIKTIEEFNTNIKEKQVAGYSTAFTLEEQIYIGRGQVMCKPSEKCLISSKLKANVFHMGKNPIKEGNNYLLKIGTEKVKCRVEEILRVIDASDLLNQEKKQVERHAVCELVLSLNNAIAFDLSSELAALSRFVLVEDFEVVSGGIIIEKVEDDFNKLREQIALRESKWYSSSISIEERKEKFQQKPILVLITGKSEIDKKDLASNIEKELFENGKNVYYLGIGNLLRGLDKDINKLEREEHIRRLGEVSNLMIHAGLIIIATASDLTERELKLLKTIMNEENILTIGFNGNTGKLDKELTEYNINKNKEEIINYLKEQKVI